MLTQLLAASAAFSGPLAVGTSRVSVSMMAGSPAPQGLKAGPTPFWERNDFKASRTAEPKKKLDGSSVLKDPTGRFWDRSDWKSASDKATASQPIQASAPTNKPAQYGEGKPFKFGGI